MLTIQETLSQAVGLHKKGLLSEARKLYLEVLAAEPYHADALNLLGVVALQCHHYEDAIAYLTQAISSNKQAPFHNNLGLVYKHLDRYDAAQVQFETALEINPDHLDSAINLALLWQDSERIVDAYELLKAHYPSGRDHPQYLYNLSSVCIKAGAFAEARKTLERLLAKTPNDGGALFNYGMLLKNMGDIDAAKLVFEKLIAHPVKSDEAKWFLGQCLLLQGEYPQGWKYFSTRFNALNIKYRGPDLPQWKSGNSISEPLLVWAEQGIGDELLFSSHIPLLIPKCSTIYYECDARLKPLFERTYGDITFFERKEDAHVTGENMQAEVHCSAGDLIRFTNPELNIQKDYSTFLTVDPERAKALAPPPSASLNIGLSYHTSGSNAKHRMPPESFWEVLRDFDDQINLIDLQSNQRNAFSPPESLRDTDFLKQINHIDLYNDIDGLAALISTLDHVISIDNSVVHLAANLGVPTTLLLSTIHDWRWLHNKQVVPWYPTTGLIRQKQEGNWDSVGAELVKKIESLIKKNN